MCDVESAEANVTAGAPEHEIEVTPEMIEAGREVVLEIMGRVIPRVGGEASDLAMGVYLAMTNVRRCGQ